MSAIQQCIADLRARALAHPKRMVLVEDIANEGALRELVGEELLEKYSDRCGAWPREHPLSSTDRAHLLQLAGGPVDPDWLEFLNRFGSLTWLTREEDDLDALVAIDLLPIANVLAATIGAQNFLDAGLERAVIFAGDVTRYSGAKAFDFRVRSQHGCGAIATYSHECAGEQFPATNELGKHPERLSHPDWLFRDDLSFVGWLREQTKP